MRASYTQCRMKLRKLFYAVIVSLGSGASLLHAAQPTNDNFADATPIITFPAQVPGNTFDATLEENEPLPDPYLEASIWFTWTASTSTAVHIHTDGADCYMAIWTGNALNELTLIAQGWDGLSDWYGWWKHGIYFDAVSGQTYRIAAYTLWPDEDVEIPLTLTNDTSARIEGTITGPDNTTPLPGIGISAYEWSSEYEMWWPLADAISIADGTYSIRGLTSNTYRVDFYDPNDNYLGEAYDDVSDVDSGADIFVAEGAHVTGINASLAAAAKLSGSITELDGVTPIASIHAQAYWWDGSDWVDVGEDHTDANGDYTITGLPPGVYRLRFSSWQDYLWELYDNISIPSISWYATDPELINSGFEIVLTNGQHLAGLNADLVPASKITGTISSALPFIPVQAIWVQAWLWDGTDWVGTGSADIVGGEELSFLIGGLREGTYRLTFTDLYGEFESLTWSNAPDIESGIDLIVPATSTVTDINVTLQPVTPNILELQKTDSGTFQLTFRGLNGREYILQHAETADGEWEDVGNTTNAVEGENDVSISAPSQDHGVWRVKRIIVQ